MRDQALPGGVIHGLPADLDDALRSRREAMAVWHDITPLARNAWIGWIETARRSDTRRTRISWGCESLEAGRRRPCCWPGCPHRERSIKVSTARSRGVTAAR